MITAPNDCNREVLETARHEAGHALAFWWNGQAIHAVEMRRYDDNRPRIDRKGRVKGPDVRAAVEGAHFIPAPTLAIKHPEIMAHYEPEVLRDIVARDMLIALAGPAVDWRNTRDPELVIEGLGEMLDMDPPHCWGDREAVDTLLAILPEEERDKAYTTACNRAEVLVSRYWRELCALADSLTMAERLEDEALDAALIEAFGEQPGWQKNPLSSLDVGAIFGGVDVVAWWSRRDVSTWKPRALADDMPLILPFEIIHLSVEDLADEPEADLPGWYCVDHDTGEIYATAPPATGPLQSFLSDMVGAKLEELRRDPDTPALNDALTSQEAAQ